MSLRVVLASTLSISFGTWLPPELHACDKGGAHHLRVTGLKGAQRTDGLPGSSV